MAANATREDVARLLGRAGFGATQADMDAWVGKPYADLVAWLVDLPATRPPQADVAEQQALMASSTFFYLPGLYVKGSQSEPDPHLAQAQGWWLRRMAATPYPLEERMTLLWHGHFATGRGMFYPDSPMLVRQNETLRLHALGNFRDMVNAMNVDIAMLHWLSGVENSIPEPNENYAREFLELFTLGKLPQVYSEKDIREAARAFTGWYVDALAQQPRFDPSRHDKGRKTILRQAVNDLGENEHRKLTDIALAQPVASRFIAYKLVTGLGYQPVRTNQLTKPDGLVKTVSDELRASNWDIKRAVRKLLLDPRYRYTSARHSQQMVREPIVIVVHACRALGLSPDSAWQIAEALHRMGQVPFRPPNVGGWPTEREWFSPATMIARYDFGLDMYDAHRGRSVGSVPSAVTLPAAADLNGWIRLLGLPGLAPTTSAALRGFLGTATETSEQERQAGVLALLLASPDWMVM